MNAEKHRIEQTFQEGDLVYLRLHPYRKYSLKEKGAENFQPRFYGPYRVVRGIGEVACDLELPARTKIHNVFHISCLKKEFGKQMEISKDILHLMMKDTW